jgi:hypothetical protein
MVNIHISASDKRNITSTFSIPFRRYEKPNIQLIGLENAILEGDTIILLPPESTLKFKITSIIGLTEITYKVGDIEERIRLNGDKEYVLTIKI